MKELDLLKTIALMGVEEEYHELILNSQEYLQLKQALSPPTAEEVCKALSEYYGETISVKRNTFWNKDGFFVITIFDGKFIQNSTYGFKYYLPPHLITLIGRFYEGEKE